MTNQFSREETEEIPFPLVLLVGLMIWAVIFGTIVAHAAVSPCSFIKLNAGTPNLQTMTQLGYDLADDTTCRTIIKSTLVLNGPSEFPKAPALENR